MALLESVPHSVYSKKPIRNLSATKGLKIRVPQSDLLISMAQAMGATPITTPDVSATLKFGAIDAAEVDYLDYESGKFYETAPVFSETELSM